MGLLHRVLILLLEEHVPISNMTRILECLANHAATIKDPVELTERVRAELGRIICDRFRDSTSKVSAIVLDPRLEMELRRSLHDKNLVLQPLRLEKLIVCSGQRLAQIASGGQGRGAADRYGAAPPIAQHAGAIAG